MIKKRKYDEEYKGQAVKLAKEIGIKRAANDLRIPERTLHGWAKVCREEGSDIWATKIAPSLEEEVKMLRKQAKEHEKKIRRLEEENEFLEEASAFFAASRQKLKRGKE